MKLIIDIPKEEYNIIKNFNAPMTWAEHLIAKGTPVQSAHWVLYRDHKDMIDYPQCSNCDTIIKLPLPIDNLNFCPKCGRKMEEENESACL